MTTPNTPSWITGTQIQHTSRMNTTATPTDATITDAKVAANAAISADKLVDGTTNKVMLATERTKLTGVATSATANATDAQLRDRSTHTGTQSADSLTDGTTNKAFLATERTKLTGVATAATANAVAIMPTNAIAQSFDRMIPTASTGVTSGTLLLVLVSLNAGQVIAAGNIRTTAYTGTHAWAGIWSTALSCLAISPDDTTSSVPTGTRTYNFSYTVPTTGAYYLGVCLVGTSPLMLGSPGASAGVHVAPTISNGTSTTGATTPPAVASTATAVTAAGFVPYIWLT